MLHFSLQGSFLLLFLVSQPILSQLIGPRASVSNITISLVDIVNEAPSFENLLLFDGGKHILATSTQSPALFAISTSNEYLPTKVAAVPGYSGLLGIEEIEPGIVYVISSNLTSSEGSNAVWRIDLRNASIGTSELEYEHAPMTLVQEIPSARQLNGMTRLRSGNASSVLLSDSAKGTVIRLDVNTGVYETVIQMPEFQPTEGGINVGVNGIHVHGDDLFFVSLDQRIFGKTPIDQTGVATGPVEILASNITFGDDFAISKCGTLAWIATNGPEEVIEINIAKKSSRVLASSAFLGAASSVAAQKVASGNRLYVTGGLDFGTTTRAHMARIDELGSE
ncbi:putative hetero-Diels-Alderase asR5 [Paramyrothecium foliicola]|nr:putative hetero-Diels-Alderase asR5 [Paramyrothecium foliicola]